VQAGGECLAHLDDAQATYYESRITQHVARRTCLVGDAMGLGMRAIARAQCIEEIALFSAS
jgi:hypothetical protein